MKLDSLGSLAIIILLLFAGGGSRTQAAAQQAGPPARRAPTPASGSPAKIKALAPAYVEKKSSARILTIRGEVRIRRANSLALVPAAEGTPLYEGDRVVTGRDSWTVLESRTAYGRSAISLGAFQVFAVDPYLLPSNLVGPRMQPNPFDVLTAKRNAKATDSAATFDLLAGLFDIGSIPYEPQDNEGAAAPDQNSDNRSDSSPAIEGPRLIVEMRGLEVFFPRQSVYVTASKRNWSFNIDLERPLAREGLLLIRQTAPKSEQVQSRVIKKGSQTIPITGLGPGDYSWQIFSGDLKQRSRLGTLYVSGASPNLLPLPPRVMPGDSVLFFD